MTNHSILRFGKELKEVQLTHVRFLIDEKIDESQTLEYKKPTNNHQKDCDNVAEVIAGLLNTEGGIIVYGISEKSEKEHRYPDKIVWSTCSKETLENLLISRVQPWDERINIRRIENEHNLHQGIFIIEVPKSTNPPHMSNYKYYQRLNFQTKPMEHESVHRVFQTSWIRRSDLSKNVVEPLYAEIKGNCWCIRNYRGTLDGKYQQVTEDATFLYDTLETLLRRKIDEFYDRLEEYRFILSEVTMLTSRMINEELCRIKPDLKPPLRSHIRESNFQINLSLRDASGNIQLKKGIYIEDALLKKKSLKKYLQSKVPLEEIIEIQPIIFEPRYKLSMSELRDFWEGLKVEVKKNIMYKKMWNERSELLNLGKSILKELKS